MSFSCNWHNLSKVKITMSFLLCIRSLGRCGVILLFNLEKIASLLGENYRFQDSDQDCLTLAIFPSKCLLHPSSNCAHNNVNTLLWVQWLWFHVLLFSHLQPHHSIDLDTFDKFQKTVSFKPWKIVSVVMLSRWWSPGCPASQHIYHHAHGWHMSIIAK